jgi:hypothetical protein
MVRAKTDLNGFVFQFELLHGSAKDSLQECHYPRFLSRARGAVEQNVRQFPFICLDGGFNSHDNGRG